MLETAAFKQWYGRDALAKIMGEQASMASHAVYGAGEELVDDHRQAANGRLTGHKLEELNRWTGFYLGVEPTRLICVGSWSQAMRKQAVDDLSRASLVILSRIPSWSHCIKSGEADDIWANEDWWWDTLPPAA